MNKPATFIENISLKDCANGMHLFQEFKTILIQIQDYDVTGKAKFVQPKFKDDFVAIYKFRFEDTHDESIYSNCITDDDARRIAEILVKALDLNRHVVVHCHAGVCRSGAVAEVGEMLGFTPTGKFKIPNTLVKKKLLKALYEMDAKYECFQPYEST